MINYKVAASKNPLTKQMVYYPAISKTEQADVTEMLAQIEKYCSLTESDIKGALSALETVIGRMVADGHSVRLSRIGSFRPGIHPASTAETEDKVNDESIGSVGCIFTPSSMVVRALREVKFEMAE